MSVVVGSSDQDTRAGTGQAGAGSRLRGRVVLAVRGAAGVAPGLATIEHAAATGTDWVSVEVRRTRDDHLVLLRCSDLRGTIEDAEVVRPLRVEDLSLADVRRLRLDAVPHRTGIATLADVLRRWMGRPKLLLDFPIGPRMAPLDRSVVGELEAAGGLERTGAVAVRSRDLDGLVAVAEDLPEVLPIARLGSSAARFSLGLLSPVLAGISVPGTSVSVELVAEATAQGLAVVAEHVGDTGEADRLRSVGAAVIETADPRIVGHVRTR